MKTYFVVNEKEKDEFEKKYQAPYGLHTCPNFDFEESAVGFVETSPYKGRNDLIVERWENGECTVVYRGIWYTTELDMMDENRILN